MASVKYWDKETQEWKRAGGGSPAGSVSIDPTLTQSGAAADAAATGARIKAVEDTTAGNSVFSGKTASFYGDSLTEMNYHYTKGYHKWVSEILGLDMYNNYGVSGHKTADTLGMVTNISDTSDIIFIMIGVNDVQFNVPLGTMSDLESDTVYGNLDSMCAKLREKYPTKLVVFITPAEQTRYPSSIGVSMRDIQRATKEVCEKHSVVVYDCYNLSEICKANLSHWTTDYCHWNDRAHEMVGKNLAQFVLNTFRYIPESSGGNTKTLTSITATFSQGDAVIYDTATLDSLKQYLTVAAKYSDGSTATVTGYTLSGTLTEGVSTITVSYGGKTATFTVNVTKYEPGEEPETPETNEWTFQTINNSVSGVTYEDRTLTLTGLNQLYGGVIFDGAKEMSINIADNPQFKERYGFGWIIARDGNVFHGIGLNTVLHIEQFDFTSDLSNATAVECADGWFPPSGAVIARVEDGHVNLYFNADLKYSLVGDAVGYIISETKPNMMYGVTIA